MSLESDNVHAIQRLEEALLELGKPEVTYALLPEVREDAINFNLHLDGSIIHTFTIRRISAETENVLLFYQHGEEYIPLEKNDVSDFAQEFLNILDSLDSFYRDVRAPLLDMYINRRLEEPVLPLIPQIQEIARKGELSFPESYAPSNEEEAKLFLENILYLSRPDIAGKESVDAMIIGLEHLSNMITFTGDRPVSGIETYHSGNNTATTLRYKLVELACTKDNI